MPEHHKIQQKRIQPDIPAQKLISYFSNLSHQIMQYANRGLSRIDFIQQVGRTLLTFSGCDALEMRVAEREKLFCGISTGTEAKDYQYLAPPWKRDAGEKIPTIPGSDPEFEQLCQVVLLNQSKDGSERFTKNGSFWSGGEHLQNFELNKHEIKHSGDLNSKLLYPSICIIPLQIESVRIGLLILKSFQANFFSMTEVEFYEGLSQTLVDASAHRRAQIALRERVKELTCLYGIAKVTSRFDIPLEENLQRIVELLPPAWLYPEIASARIRLDHHTYKTTDYKPSPWKLTATIRAGGKKRGIVEVVYSTKRPQLDEGPFLKEERSLLDTVTNEVGLIIERQQAQEEKSKLQDQLRHADRLATIGQLAAGVAHELNEPLSNILGFAQLAAKCPDLPEQAGQDLNRIVNASLFAREVIKKLMLFSRQMPPQKYQVNLNHIIAESLYFFESRCTKAGIKLIRELDPELPEMVADPAQITQVLINLVVNAVHAMPSGGKLIVRTKLSNGNVVLQIADTGTGIKNELKDQIFMPFFTTKDVDQGTGLGLAVVHGIVTSHQGSIDFESKTGQGTTFTVKLPISNPADQKDNS